MQAKVGDTLVVPSNRIGTPDRRGRIVEVHGADGGPPYVVQWSNDPHDEPHPVLFFPGQNVLVEHEAA